MIWLANQTKSKLGGVNNKKKKEQNAIVFNKNNWFESTIDWIIQPVFDSSLTTVHAKMKMIIKERERERDKIEIFYERRLYQFQEEEMVDWLIDWLMKSFFNDWCFKVRGSSFHAWVLCFLAWGFPRHLKGRCRERPSKNSWENCEFQCSFTDSLLCMCIAIIKLLIYLLWKKILKPRSWRSVSLLHLPIAR